MTSKFIYVIMILFLSTKNSNGEFDFSLKRFEYEKVVEIVKRLEIRHCILIRDHDQHSGTNFDNLKIFSKEKIMMTVMKHEKLINYLEVGAFPNAETIIVMKEINLMKIVEIFENFENVVHNAHRFTWIVFVEFYNLFDAKKLNVPYNCRFLISYLVKASEYKLIEVYKVKNQSFISEFETIDDKKLIYPNDFLYLKRMNFNGTELILNYYNKKVDKDVVASYRQIVMLHDIAKMMNFYFTYKATNITDYQNLDYDGDVLDLNYPFHSYFFRINWLGPMFEMIINWSIKYPDMENRGDYIEPFDDDLWYCIVSVIILEIFFLILMKKFGKEKVSTVDVAFIGTDSLCYQDGNNDFNINYLRIIIMATRLTAMLIIPAYNAVITSFLAIREHEVPFKNLEEFVDNGEYLMTFPKQTFIDFYFKDSHHKIPQYIYKNLSLIFDFASKYEIGERLCEEKLAVAYCDNVLYWPDLKCDVFRIEHPVTVTMTGISLNKHSPFTKVWNYNLIRFYTSGIQEKMQKLTEDDYDVNHIDDVLDPVEMKQIYQLLIVLGVGIVLAGVIFLFEIFSMNFKNKNRRRKQKKIKR